MSQFNNYWLDKEKIDFVLGMAQPKDLIVRSKNMHPIDLSGAMNSDIYHRRSLRPLTPEELAELKAWSWSCASEELIELLRSEIKCVE